MSNNTFDEVGQMFYDRVRSRAEAAEERVRSLEAAAAAMREALESSCCPCSSEDPNCPWCMQRERALSTNAGRDYAERMRLAEGLIREIAGECQWFIEPGCSKHHSQRFYGPKWCPPCAARAWLNGAASKERG